jgi:hypothetical protein
MSNQIIDVTGFVHAYHDAVLCLWPKFLQKRYSAASDEWEATSNLLIKLLIISPALSIESALSYKNGEYVYEQLPKGVTILVTPCPEAEVLISQPLPLQRTAGEDVRWRTEIASDLATPFHFRSFVSPVLDDEDPNVINFATGETCSNKQRIHFSVPIRSAWFGLLFPPDVRR